MKKAFLKGSVITVLSLAVLFTGVLWWAIYTERGTGWAVGNILSILPVEMDFRKISGSFYRGLVMEGTHISSEDWNIRIGTFRLSLQPRSILHGRGIIDIVDAQGIVVEDRHPERKEPLDLTWPKIPRYLSYINMQVRKFTVKNVTYRSGDSCYKLFDELKGTVSWALGRLTARDLYIRTPFMTAEGILKTRFSDPAFSANVVVQTGKSASGITSLHLKTTMKNAGKTAQMAGDVSIVALSGKDRFAEGTGRLSLGHTSLDLTHFAFSKKGLKGRLIATGLLDCSTVDPVIQLGINASGIDLSKELGTDTSISGTISLTSDFTGYNGKIDIYNSGPAWKEVSLSGNFTGDEETASLSDIRGRLLGGELRGSARFSFNDGISLTGSLQARNTNPSLALPRLTGKINVDIEGSASMPQGATPELAFKAKVLNSVVHDKPFTGQVSVQWSRDVLHIPLAEFVGRGFYLEASGNTAEKLVYRFRIDDLGGIIDGSHGRISASGWLRHHKRQLSGLFQGDARTMSLFSLNTDTLHVSAEFNTTGDDNLKGMLKTKGVGYGNFRADSVNLSANGALARHNIILTIAGKKERISAAFNGGYTKKTWQGTCPELQSTGILPGTFSLARSFPLTISREKFFFGPLIMTSGGGESFRCDADLAFAPTRGHIKATWQNLNFVRLQGLLSETLFTGKTSGSSVIEWAGKQPPTFIAEADFHDVTMESASAIRGMRGDTKIKWNKNGLAASWDVKLGDKGTLDGTAWSKEAMDFGVPKNTHFKTIWKDIDMALFKPLLPAALNADGTFSGEAKGLFLTDARFELEGLARLNNGRLIWKDNKREAAIGPENIDLKFNWKNNSAKGSFSLTSPGRTRIGADTEIPVPARFPLRINHDGDISATAKGELIEKGLLTAFFPGLIENSEGKLGFDLSVSGSWNNPSLNGKARLSGASAYFYPAGIRLKDVESEVTVQNDKIDVTSFSLRSGEGSIQGSATAHIKKWKLTHYEGRLRGSNARIVYLPELQVTASPDLSFSGDLQKVKIRGSILIPGALVQKARTAGVVSSSSDVVLVDERNKGGNAGGVTLDAEVNVSLGDHIFIKAEGIDAKLTGSALLSVKGRDRINAKGRMTIANGTYKRYGLELNIDRGHVAFNGGPVELGILDILAVRKIRYVKAFNDIRAGVAITGTIKSPLVKLYSEPSMSDADIISYTLFGKPASQGDQTAQAGRLMQAAGMLLSKDEARSVQGQIKRLLGIDTIEVQAEEGSDTLSGSIISVGKYLSPDLYIAFGRSLFSGDYVVTTRYSFLKNWEIEGIKKGTDNGVDVYYKIEFR